MEGHALSSKTSVHLQRDLNAGVSNKKTPHDNTTKWQSFVGQRIRTPSLKESTPLTC